MDQSPAVLIVIVNYRTPDLTIRCAQSLRSALEHFPRARVVLVDNGSGDDSVEQLSAALLHQELCERVCLLALPQNVGYAAGNNAAICPALNSGDPPDYIWLLNSDTRVQPNALGALIGRMERHPRAGIAGSRLENAVGEARRSAFRFPGIAGEWEANVRWSWMTRLCARWVMAPPVPREITQTDWVPGASMLIRRAVLEDIGLLDEKFFVYYEDVDFCRRARRAGWETWYVPESRVEHYTGASSGVNAARRLVARMPGYWFGARRYYFLKHHRRIYALCADAVWLLGFGFWRVRLIVQRKSDSAPPRMWRDFLANSVRRSVSRGSSRMPE